jgi:hypothetical protein
MEIDDFDGHVTVHRVSDLQRRLKTVRRGNDGAFILCHEPKGPSLLIHVNKDIAHLHYFPDGEGKHPGYIPGHESGAGRTKDVCFLLVGGDEASAILPAPESLVSLDTAYRAAADFFRDPALPSSVSWIEL